MFSRQQLLATAEASPAAVARHDRAAWLALFATDAEVHDPVGSRGHAGRVALERFYDTFIAPNEIHFEVAHDLVCGSTVVRDLVIVTRMGGTALEVRVPLFIRYEIVAAAGEPKVRRLYAHWELLPMMSGQVFASGLVTGLQALIALSANMLRHQGLGGALGFSRAFFGVGRAAKRTAQAFLQAASHGDADSAGALLTTGAELHRAGEDAPLTRILAQLGNARWEKMLAGGRQVTARLHTGEGHAVIQFDFAESAGRISGLRLYTETKPSTTSG